MVKCFVVFCKSGYSSCKEKVSMFKVPQDNLFDDWRKAIPKREIELGLNSHICSKHFKKNEVLWAWTSGAGESQISIPLQRPKLLKGAIPSIFPGCPLSCIPKTTIKRKSPKKRVVQSNIDSCVATTPIVKISECDQELQITNITSTLEFGFDEQLIFNVWDTLLTIELPDSSWVSYQINEMKILAQMEMSSHLEPRSVVVKEVRVMKNYNEISQFILGKPFETSQKVTSSFQLKTIVYSLHSLAICRGVSPEISYYAVHIMKKGYINILNCWQSVECKFQIEEPNKSICSKCILLSRALTSKVSRLSKDKNKSLSTLLSCGKRKKVIRTRQAIRKSRIRLLHKNNQLEEMVKSYKQKIDSISEETIQQHIKRLNLNSAQGMVINECLRIGKFNSKTSRRYSNDWLLTCLLMQIRSPAMYKFMLKNEILPLPCVQTIKRHLSLVKLDFGFDPAFFEMFKKKINLKTEQQKYGVLIFDEMSVRKSLKTDPKTLRYQGVVDFGNDDIGSTKNEALADHALVFGFSSLCENYFQPIGCFAAKGATNGVTLAKLIVQAILLLEHAGAKVTGIICDGAKPNRRMWKEFGITGELGAVKHFFYNPHDESRKIFVLSDTPHLFKCIRNRLLAKELMTSFGLVRWRHYQILYNEEKNLPGNTRVCPKLTESHVNPCSFAKMRVSFMTQIFSKSVYVGLNMYRERLTEELVDSEPTAKFSLFLNNLFDCLNRRYPGEGIKPDSPDINTIKDGIAWLNCWESEVSNKIVSPEQFLTKETAEGLRVSLHSTVDLIEYLHSVGFDYVLTSKANQDKIEQFFGTIRQAGCQNDHPAMPTFQQLYRLISTYKLLKPPKFGNCSVNNDEILEGTEEGTINFDDYKSIFGGDTGSTALQKLKNRLDLIVEYDDWEGEDLIANNYKSPELVGIVIYYASGYLCRRLLKTTKCETCLSSLLTNLDTSNLAVAELISMKTKGFLLNCNLYLYDIFLNAEKFFVKNVIYSDCYEKTLTDIIINVNLKFPCNDHKSSVIASSLHYYIRMRMRQYEREQNRSCKKKSRNKKKESKLYVT